jgi:hypothetical protein
MICCFNAASLVVERSGCNGRRGSAGVLSRTRHGLLPRERNCRMIKLAEMRAVVASRSWCWCCLRMSLERVYPKLMWPPVSLSDLEKGNLKQSHSGAKRSRSDRLATFFRGPFSGRMEPIKRRQSIGS